MCFHHISRFFTLLIVAAASLSGFAVNMPTPTQIYEQQCGKNRVALKTYSKQLSATKSLRDKYAILERMAAVSYNMPEEFDVNTQRLNVATQLRNNSYELDCYLSFCRIYSEQDNRQKVQQWAEKIYANNISIDVDTMQVDSTAVLLPRVKGGEVRAIESVLDRLDIPMDEDSLHTRWARTSREEEVRKVQLQDVTLREGLVPLVVGMGAKDAVYLLEQAGLHVTLTGIGRVASQSIPAGHKVVKGQGIWITLK